MEKYMTNKEKELHSCSGCIDDRSEGTHQMHTFQHPCPPGGDPDCGYCFPSKENTEPYEHRSHSHCWEQKVPACGLRTIHLRCCLCSLPAPTEPSFKEWEEDDSPYRTALAEFSILALHHLQEKSTDELFTNALIDGRNAVDAEVEKIAILAHSLGKKEGEAEGFAEGTEMSEGAYERGKEEGEAIATNRYHEEGLKWADELRKEGAALAAKIVEGWHYKKGGYNELAHAIKTAIEGGESKSL